jgi:hypothetical protein
MAERLYPIFYGTRLVTIDVIRDTFEPNAHPEAFRRLLNFLIHQGGKFGIGGGYRPPGTQPNNKPGFAPPTKSFHEGQVFPSGVFYCAWDLVVVNPGFPHRAPTWDEVPVQGSQLAIDYGLHMNVGSPGIPGSESWHEQPVEIDGWDTWVRRGRPDLKWNYPIKIFNPRPEIPQPPVPPTQPESKEIILEVKSRILSEGAVGTDVKFFQRILNEVAGQGLIMDGYYGPTTANAVRNWQRFFGAAAGLTVDGVLGPKTQQSMIEISLQV